MCWCVLCSYPQPQAPHRFPCVSLVVVLKEPSTTSPRPVSDYSCPRLSPKHRLPSAPRQCYFSAFFASHHPAPLPASRSVLQSLQVALSPPAFETPISRVPVLRIPVSQQLGVVPCAHQLRPWSRPCTSGIPCLRLLLPSLPSPSPFASFVSLAPPASSQRRRPSRAQCSVTPAAACVRERVCESRLLLHP